MALNRKLLSAFWYEGKPYEFNFSKFWTFTRTKFDFEETPDGTKRHNNLWNGGNGRGTVKLWEKKGGKLVLIDDMTFTHCGCEYGEYD